MKKSGTKPQSIEITVDESAIPAARKKSFSQKHSLHVNDRYLLNSLMNNLPEHIYFKDCNSRFIRISKSLAEAFGLDDPSAAIGKSDFDFFSPEHARRAFRDEQKIMHTGKTISTEERETWPDRPDTWVLTTKMPLYGESGQIIGTYGISRDITDRKMAEDKLRLQSKSLQKQIQEINILHDQLKEQACRDALTGLSNRRMMEEVLSQQLVQCRKLELPCSIFIIDIDHFKNINDVYGHLLGDAILEKIGICIKSLTRADDFSCRLGGDEILLSFKNMPAQQAVKKAQFIRRMLGQLYVMKDKQKISTTVSIGIATFPIHGDCIHALIDQADAALYLAKERGRNQVVLASEVEAKLPGPK